MITSIFDNKEGWKKIHCLSLKLFFYGQAKKQRNIEAIFISVSGAIAIVEKQEQKCSAYRLRLPLRPTWEWPTRLPATSPSPTSPSVPPPISAISPSLATITSTSPPSPIPSSYLSHILPRLLFFFSLFNLYCISFLI